MAAKEYLLTLPPLMGESIRLARPEARDAAPPIQHVDFDEARATICSVGVGPGVDQAHTHRRGAAM